jgi:hypothetical protein
VGETVAAVTVQWDEDGSEAVYSVEAGQNQWAVAGAQSKKPRPNPPAGEAPAPAPGAAAASPCRAALGALFRGAGGQSWAYKAGWMTDAALGGWHGVGTQIGMVTVIDLGGNALSGAIPAELGELRALRILGLHNNGLTGRIPAALGGLSALLALHLGRNRLTGPIPDELGGLHGLSRLNLAANHLTGPIPSALARLPVLAKLALHENNQLTGQAAFRALMGKERPNACALKL